MPRARDPAIAILLRTAVPPIQAAQGKRVTEVLRIGKRIVIGLESDLWLVFHLMIGGRLHWFAKRLLGLKARGTSTSGIQQRDTDSH